MAEMLGKKKQASLDIFVEVENMELEYELAFRGDVLLSQVALGEANGLMTFLKLGRSRSAMQALGMRSRGPAGAVCCEVGDAGMQ